MLHIIVEKLLVLVLQYKIESLIAPISVMVVSILAANFKKKTNSQKEKLLSKCKIILDVISALALIIIFIINTNFTLIPNVLRLNSEDAKRDLQNAGLSYNLEDFREDEGKIVYSVYPDVGTPVKKKTEVSVVLLNKNNSLFYEKLSLESEYKFDKDTDNIDPFNTNKIELVFEDIGIYMHTENPENTRKLGQETLKGAIVELIEYNTQKVVFQKACNESGHVIFDNIPSGTYVYRISCSGYKTYISDQPFKLELNSNYEEVSLVWGINLKNDDEFYTKKFKIKIIDENGNPVIGKKFDVCPIKEDTDSNTYSYMPVWTDENGYISLWREITINGVATEYFDLVTFELNKKYVINIIDKNGNCKTIEGPINRNIYEIKF